MTAEDRVQAVVEFGFPLDHQQWAGVVTRQHEHQPFLGAAERHIEKAPCIVFIGKRLGVARHDDHAVALQSLGLVNRAERPRRRLRPRKRPLVGDFCKADVGTVKVSQSDGVPEFPVVVQFDFGESRVRFLAFTPIMRRLTAGSSCVRALKKPMNKRVRAR